MVFLVQTVLLNRRRKDPAFSLISFDTRRDIGGLRGPTSMEERARGLAGTSRVGWQRVADGERELKT